MTDNPVQPTDGEYTPLMPIILVKSHGGPFDDAAYVAGATMGALDEEFRVLRLSRARPRERYMDARYLRQADLIAMRHGYTMTPGELDAPSGWQVVTFEFVGEQP